MPLINKKQQPVQICEDNNKSSNNTLVNEEESEYRNGTQEYIEYEVMTSEKFRYYLKSGKIFPVKGTHKSWIPKQKQTNYEDIENKRIKAEEKKENLKLLIQEKIEKENYKNEGVEER